MALHEKGRKNCAALSKMHGIRMMYPRKYYHHFSIKDVVSNHICIGCGVCTYYLQIAGFSVQHTNSGIFEIESKMLRLLDDEAFEKANLICPFSDYSPNEDELGPPTPTDLDVGRDEHIGTYYSLLAGRINNDQELLQSSSGGLTSWLAIKLLKEKKIDAVVHVGQANDSDQMYGYRISRTIEDIKNNRKSAYHPATLQDVLASIKNNPELRYALIGVPCFIKAVRLLALVDKKINSRIAFYIGLVCGHMKSSLYAESLAWQAGIDSDDVKHVDFRVKIKGRSAGAYNFRVHLKDSSDCKEMRTSSAKGTNWGLAAFQPNACNYCDDIFAETADITFGDAWIDKYRKEWIGTNIVVLRNKELLKIFSDSFKAKEINYEEISLSQIIRSQGGGVGHRWNGLKIRLYNDILNGKRAPAKRVSPEIKDVPPNRVQLVELRRGISSLSAQAFLQAKRQKNIQYYLNVMSEYEMVYNFLRNRQYPVVKKHIYYDVALFGWHHQSNLGGVLTFFALHQLLKFNGYKVVVVWRPGVNKITPITSVNFNVVKNFYSYSKYRQADKLYELRNYCETFMLASDQLWAGKWVRFTPEYEFLGCGDSSVKRISVATSTGGGGEKLNFDGEELAIVKYLLSQIDHVSVREPNGVSLLKGVGVDSTQILDPVFLCPKSEYNKLIDYSKFFRPEKNYILSYYLDPTDSLIQASESLRDKYKFDFSVYMTTTGEKSAERWSRWPVDIRLGSSVADFVDAIKNSAFVCTDSFHGACCAIIFNKPFFFAPPDHRGVARKAVIEQFGLSNRIFGRSSDELVIDRLTAPIDWGKVNFILEKMKVDSLRWLSSALDKADGLKDR